MLRQNKAFQFIVGCFVLITCYKIWSMGIFDAWWFNDPDAVNGASVIALIGTAIVSSIQMVGLLAIALVSGLQPLAEQAMEGIGSFLKRDEATTDEPRATTSIDATKLTIALEAIMERLDKMESKDGS
tara:strand:+ start:24185 stop:24568 length:384 start_codon:yes stop_codon:yes gene_type:complete